MDPQHVHVQHLLVAKAFVRVATHQTIKDVADCDCERAIHTCVHVLENCGEDCCRQDQVRDHKEHERNSVNDHRYEGQDHFWQLANHQEELIESEPLEEDENEHDIVKHVLNLFFHDLFGRNLQNDWEAN